jgi:hypothetical protein
MADDWPQEIRELRESCAYSDEGGFDAEGNDLGSVDALIEYKNALEERYAATLADEKTKWNFWLPDEDRSAGWTNHCYVLQFVCVGYGATPEEAAREAVTSGRSVDDLGVPPDFILPDNVIAIRDDHEHPGIELTEEVTT